MLPPFVSSRLLFTKPSSHFINQMKMTYNSVFSAASSGPFQGTRVLLKWTSAEKSAFQAEKRRIVEQKHEVKVQNHEAKKYRQGRNIPVGPKGGKKNKNRNKKKKKNKEVDVDAPNANVDKVVDNKWKGKK